MDTPKPLEELINAYLLHQAALGVMRDGFRGMVLRLLVGAKTSFQFS